jgi:ribonuclease D
VPRQIKKPMDPASRRAKSLETWRSITARATALLPDQICSDDDLAAIAASPPATAEELASITSFGPIAAARLFPPIRRALDTTDDPT